MIITADLTTPSSCVLLNHLALDLVLRQGTPAQIEAEIARLREAGGADSLAVASFASGQLALRLLGYDDAARWFATAADQLIALGRAPAAAFSRAEQALALCLGYRGERARAVLAQAAALVDRLPGDSPDVRGVQALLDVARGSLGRTSGGLVEALSSFDRALERQSGQVQARVLLGLGSTLRLLSQRGLAAQRLTAAAAHARHTGDPLREGMALGQLALLSLDQGELEQARGHAKRQVALARALGDVHGEARGRVVLAEVLLCLQLSGAAQNEARAGMECDQGRTPALQVYGELISARALIGTGHHDEASGHAQRAAVLLRTTFLPEALFIERAIAALLLGVRGDRAGVRAADAASRAAMRIAPVARTMGVSFELLGQAFRALGAVAKAADRARRAQISSTSSWLGEGLPGEGPGEEPDQEPQGRTVRLGLWRAAQLTLLLRALTFDEELVPAVGVLLHCRAEQRGDLYLCADRVRGASAGQLGALCALVLEPVAPATVGAALGGDSRLATLGTVGEVVAARPISVRGLINDLGEVILESGAWVAMLEPPTA